MEKYQVAIYMRLSKEDDRNRQESNSISMQRILLHHYVAEHFFNYEIREFVDDGYSGTNFKRPGIQTLLQNVKDGKIDCIIVKDFSRFARDYIELGTYLEQIFPFLGIRFISVNDRYDSKTQKGNLPDLDVNFKNLLYDLYSKDLSKKVRSSLAAKKERQQYVSANSPFGYEKAPYDRHMLLIEEDEAEVVKKIFSLAQAGYTSTQTAKILNEEGIKTPVAFKIEKGKTTRKPKGESFFWSSSMVCQILRNRIYVGDIVQKKYKKEYVGGKNRINPKEEWCISPDHHEPLVSRELFQEIQNRHQKKHQNMTKQQYQTTQHPLIGKILCGGCKRNLSYRKGVSNPYFYCPYHYENGKKECVKKINGMFLEQYLLYQISQKQSAEKTEELNKALVETYIWKIIVYDEQHIEIKWNSEAMAT